MPKDIPSQLPARQPAQILDASWIQTNEIPAIRPGVSTWSQVQQQQRAPITPIPQNWHDELPKPVYRQWSMPKEKKPIDLEKIAARIWLIGMGIFTFLLVGVLLIKFLMQVLLMK